MGPAEQYLVGSLILVLGEAKKYYCNEEYPFDFRHTHTHTHTHTVLITISIA